MSAPKKLPGKGPAIEVQVHDRHGKEVESIAIPEEHVAAIFRALESAGAKLPPFDPYGDTTLSHEQCRALASYQRIAADAISDPEMKICANVLLGILERAGATPGLSVTIVGN
jgi:hypothetical protein